MEPRLSPECARHRGGAFPLSKRALGYTVLALTLIGWVSGFSISVAQADAPAADAAPAAPDSSVAAAPEAAPDSVADPAAASVEQKEGEVHLNRPVAPAEVRKRRGKHVQARKQREKWWQTAQTTLFQGVDLTPDQDKQVTAIIKAQMKSRTEYSKYDIQLAAARAANDLIRARELRKSVQDARKQVRSLHEVLDSIRLVLTEKQQAVFDVNRAKLIAEGQSVRRTRIENRKKKENSGAAAAADTES